MEKLIIAAAVVGAEVTRQHHPGVPYTPEEIAAAAVESWQAGAALVHIHARNADGTPTQATAVYRDIIQRIRSCCDAIIQVSTGGAVGMDAAERLQPVYLQPEMATLTTGTVNFGDSVFWNPPDLVAQFARTMVAQGVIPEIEVFDTAMIDGALRLVRAGILNLPLHFDFVLGVPGALPGEPRHLLHLVESLPPGCTWSVAGIGRAQLPLAAMAIVLGGHVRVGFEDNIYYRKGELAASNAQLVARVVRLAGELGRPVADPAAARHILGLEPKYQPSGQPPG